MLIIEDTEKHLEHCICLTLTKIISHSNKNSVDVNVFASRQHAMIGFNGHTRCFDEYNGNPLQLFPYNTSLSTTSLYESTSKFKHWPLRSFGIDVLRTEHKSLLMKFECKGLDAKLA